MRQIVLDTETTGLHADQGHRIIEIGCIELVNRKVTGKHFHQYINPEREIEQGALAVHGITNEFLQDKPPFKTIANQFMEFVGNSELIIHNAVFDIGFINAELALLKSSWKTITDYCQVVDTLLLARKLHVGQRNNLDALCKRYSIDNSQREYHGALLDAHLLARVYLAMTGGQTTLFSATETTELTAQQQITSDTTITAKSRNLNVLKATSEEIKNHEEYLKNMQKKGQCLWVEETN